ncbi:MAG: hypothetical protein EAZ55_01460 [Cytophagales bacterium]|nr:MAG: hypothetical protein EAZ55_01460 [Cytophagales bacterium]
MNNATPILNFLIYWSIQVLILRKIQLFEVATCFLYLNFLLTLSKDLDRTVLLIIAFLLGFSVDIFYGTLGIHSAACVSIAFLRPFLLSFLTPKDKETDISLREMGFNAFFTYLLITITLHHTLVFAIDMGDNLLITQTLTHIISSVLFTFVVIFIVQFLFLSQRKNI